MCSIISNDELSIVSVDGSVCRNVKEKCKTLKKFSDAITILLRKLSINLKERVVLF